MNTKESNKRNSNLLLQTWNTQKLQKGDVNLNQTKSLVYFQHKIYLKSKMFN